MASIIINNRPPFQAAAGQSLLAALKERNVFVPSACGGHGICGLCRIKALTDAGPHTDRENALLSEADRRTGMRLACQVRTGRDLRIAVPDDYFHAREYRAEVAALRKLTPDILEITLQLRSPPAMDFKAGQYIQLRIPPGEMSRRVVLRAYSIATPPSARGRLELEVRRVLNGVGTTYIFDRLKLHESVVFNGPYGDFYLRETSRPIVMVAGGSGMAPMKAMLGDMQDRKIRRNARYFFGARSRRDLFLLDVMRQFENSLPGFQFIPALSSPLPEDHWTGETGLIAAVLERRMENPCPGEAYLCGSPAMIEACTAVLQKKGISSDRIFYDAFA